MTIILLSLITTFASCDKIDKSGWIIPEEEEVLTDAEAVVPSGLYNLSAGKFYLLNSEPISSQKDAFPIEPWSSGTLLTDEDATGSSKGCVAWRAQEAEVVVDLGSLREIEALKIHGVENANLSIQCPAKVEVYIRKNDTESWTKLNGSLSFNAQTENPDEGIWGEMNFTKSKARYVKCVLFSADDQQNMGVDEIVVIGGFQTDPKYVPSEGCYHGAFNNNTSFADNTDPSIVVNYKSCPIDTYEAQVGKQLSIMLWYQGVCDSNNKPTRMFSEMQGVRESYTGVNFDGKYRFFIYGWLPDQYTSKQLAEGVLDEYYKAYFKEIADHPEYMDLGPVWFRPANEMNSNWLQYGGDPKNYVKYWRRMYNIAEQYGLTDFNVFVWSPNDVTFNSTNHVMPEAVMHDYWPGEIYVDWVGVSCYPTSLAGLVWPEDLIEEVYTLGKRYGKPMMVSEGAYGKQVQDSKKAEWVRAYFEALKKYGFKATIWENHETDANGDRRIHTHPTALETYKEIIKDSYWLDRIPEEVYNEIERRKNK